MPISAGFGNGIADTRLKNKPQFKGGNTPAALPAQGGALGWLARGIAAVPINQKVQDFFHVTSREGSASLVLPESSVIVGRSVAAGKRGGWLELQERLPEEMAVAAIWLFGVDALQKVFEKAKSKVSPNYNHLSTNIAWDKAWGKATHVDLSPQEMFAKNQKEISTLLKIKSLRWLFSVGLALGGVAYVIPKANQWKTELVLKHLNRRKRQTEGSNVQFGDPTTKPQSSLRQRISLPSVFHHANQAQQSFNHFSPSTQNQTPPQTSQPFTIPSQPTASNPTQATFASSPIQSTTHSTAPYSNVAFQTPKQQLAKHPNQAHFQGQAKSGQSKNIQFGGLPGGSLIQGLGHLVEQTPYGSILVVDAGIAGGRGVVASKRSMFETAEVLFRDIGSLYFYILFAPHMMKGMSKVLNPPFGTSFGIEPKVSELIHKEIEKSPANFKAIKKLLNGADNHLNLMAPEGELKHHMRLAPRSNFDNLLSKETHIYLPGQKQAANALKKISDYLKEYLPETEKHLNPDNIQKLLTSIQEGRGSLAALPSEERRNLGIAVKQAFRHTVGVNIGGPEQIKTDYLFKELFEKLEATKSTETKPLLDRIKRMAQLDGLDQTHSMLRRSINVMRDSLQEKHADLLKRGEDLADKIDHALNRHLTLDELVEHEAKTTKNKLTAPELRKQITSVMDDLTAKARQATPEHTLLAHYQGAIKKLMQPDSGKLFSLATEHHDPVLGQKLREMLKGGLQNDRAFLSKALDVVGQLETSSRKFSDPGKAAKMREAIENYTEALLKKLNTPQAKGNLRKELKQFYKLNRNMHYGAWSVAMAGTMFCLGWLVPHLQTLLTLRLTGKNKHPGIASVEEHSTPEKQPEAKATPPSLISTIPFGYNPSFIQKQYMPPRPQGSH